jgi:2',3'-cyclic-nucleotide 2'-phosphodiesterase (5'-nucleotidase family)
LEQSRTDTVARLIVEAGNFAPAGRSRGDSIKVRTMADFYRSLGYDAVGLSSRELSFGVDMWKEAAHDGVPVLAANLFKDKKGKKPLFKTFIIKEDRGDRLGVIGFVSESAWRAHTDTASHVYYRSPFTQSKLIRKVAKKCDHLTVLGEFTSLEADSLIRLFPQISVVVASGVRADQVTRVGNSLIVGSSTRGNYATYVDWNYAPADTGLTYVNRQQVLDTSVPEDTSVVRLVGQMNEKLKAPAGP